MPVHPLKIDRFVNRIPKEHLPAWTVHLATRITDEFHEAFKDVRKHPQPPGD